MSLLKVYISGLNSDPNPSPGLGVARSLRLAYPGIRLVGVDYSPKCSGCHTDVFDDVLIMNVWEEIDLETYKLQIERWLSDAESYWISTLDVEIWWLASSHPNPERVLIPPISALEETRKPRMNAAKDLPFLIPPYIDACEPDEDLYEFFVNYGCYVWVKGPYYEARRVRSWSELKAEVRALSEAWGGGVYIQANVNGREEALTYAAYRGELLGAVHMVKLISTQEGKTWSGRVYEPSDEVLEALRRVVKRLNWTGGGELEIIRTPKDDLYLIDWNPRFPAWIYGATIAGYNLPAALIEAASGIRYARTPQVSRDFIRVVCEVPCMLYVNEPLVGSAAMRKAESYKHPSGMPALSRLLRVAAVAAPRLSREGERPPLVDEDVLENLRRALNVNEETPRYILLEDVIGKRFERLVSILREVSNELQSIDVRAAYSIKTNPDGRILKLANSKGFMAEAISQLEVKKALSCGYRCNEIILNGPGKFWPKPRVTGRFHAVFADSTSELSRILRHSEDVSEVLGVRVRHPLVEQRFGVDIGSFRGLVKIIELTKSIDAKLGVHFHIPSILIGMERWFSFYRAIIRYVKLLESATGKKVNVLDVGGGWSPRSFDKGFLPSLTEVVSYAHRNLDGLEEFLMEPGRALVEPGVCLMTRVIDVRAGAERKDVVVDASVAEMPLAPIRPHSILYYDARASEFRAIGRGRDRILGRLCMEDDILAVDVKIPEGVKEDDVLLFLNVGAYDVSMSYRFGRG
jgi:diaminopimelate decarboxylase